MQLTYEHLTIKTYTDLVPLLHANVAHLKYQAHKCVGWSAVRLYSDAAIHKDMRDRSAISFHTTATYYVTFT